MNKTSIYAAGIVALALGSAWLQWGDKAAVAPTQLAIASGRPMPVPTSTMADDSASNAPVTTGKIVAAQKDNYMEGKIAHHFSGGTESAREQTIPEIPIAQETVTEMEQTRQNNARAELEQRIKQLVESKEGGAQWQAQLTQLQEGWKELAQKMGTPIGFAEINCYNAGCAAKMTFSQQTDIRQFTMKVLSTKTPGQWDGDTYLSGAVEVQAGIFESTWIFTPGLKMRKPRDV